MYTLGWNVVHAGYHNDVIRFELTRKLPTLIPDLVDENQVAFNMLLGNSGNGQSVDLTRLFSQLIYLRMVLSSCV